MNLSIIGKAFLILGAVIALVQPLLLYGSIVFFIGVVLILLSEGSISAKLVWILLTVLIWFIITMTIFYILSYKNSY